MRHPEVFSEPNAVEVRREVAIVNEAGLHARPCHAIVSLALGFESALWVRCGDKEVNGKSILALMTLTAARASVLELRAVGGDADRLVERLAELIGAGFGETL